MIGMNGERITEELQAKLDKLGAAVEILEDWVVTLAIASKHPLTNPAGKDTVTP